MIEYENLAKLNSLYNGEISKAVSEVIEQGNYILGENVSIFEKEFAQFNGSNWCVGVANGLDALILGIDALELPAGSEIIVQTNTYVATVLSIIRNGHVPKFVEPNIKNYCLEADAIEESITHKTSAILVTHLYGKISDMRSICALAKKYDLKVIEDCAQAHGSELYGKKAGSFGDIGCFSFYPTKNIGALGDAGCIVSDSESIIRKLQALRNYGSSEKYHNKYIGYNSRLDELQAKILRIKLKHYDKYLARKIELASLYFDSLDCEKYILPKREENKFDVFHIFAIRHPQRDHLREILSKEGIGTAVHYPVALHKQRALRNLTFTNTKIANEISNTIVSLPCSIIHSEAEILKVIERLNEAKFTP